MRSYYTNDSSTTRRLDTFVRELKIFPKVICLLIINYSYHFEGVVEEKIFVDAKEKFVTKASLCSLSNGKVCVSVGGEVIVYDINTGEKLWSTDFDLHGTGVQLFQCKNHFFVIPNSSAGDPMCIYDATTFALVKKVQTENHRYGDMIVIDATDITRVVMFASYQLILFDHLSSLSSTSTLAPTQIHEFHVEEEIHYVGFISATRLVAVTDETYMFIEYADDKLSVLNSVQKPVGKRVLIRCSAVSGTGNVVLGGAVNDEGLTCGYMAIFKDCKAVKEIESFFGVIHQLFLLRDPDRVVSASLEIAIWNLKTGEKEFVLYKSKDRDRPRCVLLPNDDLVIDLGFEKAVFDTENGEVKHMVDLTHFDLRSISERVRDIIFVLLPDGRVVCYFDGVLTLIR